MAQNHDSAISELKEKYNDVMERFAEKELELEIVKLQLGSYQRHENLQLALRRKLAIQGHRRDYAEKHPDEYAACPVCGELSIQKKSAGLRSDDDGDYDTLD